MDLQFVHILRCLKLLFIVGMHVDKTGSITLDDLRSVCCIDSGVNEIKKLGIARSHCTAISSFSENSRTSPNSIDILREGLPYLKIYDQEGFLKMILHIESKDAMTLFINDLEKTINEEKIDAMAFDNFDSTIPLLKIDMDYQRRLRDFFKMLRAKFPNKLFGLLIAKEEIIIKYAYVPSVLDEGVQFYLLRSLSYKQCKREGHQIEMANTSPVEDIQRTIEIIKQYEFDIKRVLLSIRIVVNNALVLNASGEDDTSYSTHCSTNIDDWSKYCSESLEGFYAKGVLVYSYKMLGGFLHSIDRDDYDNKCSCGAFAALNVINAGMNGSVSPQITGCPTWGLLPNER